jgi:PTS system nitrogen regulatory IIA component
MYLSVKQAAKLMDISEKTLYRWIGEGTLPAFRVKGQYRFNRVELLEWVTAKRIAVSPDLMLEPESVGAPLPRLCDVVTAHDIHYRVAGHDKTSVIRNALLHLRLPNEVDRGNLLKILLAREDLGTTAMGRGIAIPHVRNPLVLHVEEPAICICFLENAIEFHALDGEPVRFLFLLVSPTLRSHLHLMSRLAAVLQNSRFYDALKSEAGRESLLEILQTVENSLASGTALVQLPPPQGPDDPQGSDDVPA